MHETQTRVGDELPNSDGPTFAKLMTMAERELGAFISAVTELFGSGQVTGRLSAVARASCKAQEPEILSSRLEVSRYLVYLNNRAAGKSSVKTIDLSDQKTAPLTPKSLIYNRRSYSQAGRRRFEPGLPLHLFNNLHASPNQLLSHLSRTGYPLDSADHNLLCRPFCGFCTAD